MKKLIICLILSVFLSACTVGGGFGVGNGGARIGIGTGIGF